MIRDALKNTIVPVLRSHGFRGRYPHFRRLQGDHCELLCLYIVKLGDAFYIETSNFPLEGCTTY
ncbi:MULTISPECIES: DUF4304 domain-containing protein [unclassified Exiguobacterium]|uniref:DUF4304 domain-containing protein n=1 Tax=unclassified Exiguobacterium TaxID=2644629 RepID=UPI0033367F27